MCGIAGRFAAQGGLDARSIAEIAAMTENLRHRGPDAGGMLDRTPLGVLGHRRLAIIDLSQGQQPMGTADQNLWVTFNGEIYNYLELRRELEGRGHSFRTNSDTEVILAGYREWGEAVPERLEGMFAFAVLDLNARRLFLARDHLGKKPLYIRFRGGVLDFASEVGALRGVADWRGEVDPLGVAFYLRFGYVPSPWSIYRDVQKLQPGECCTVDAAGLRRRRYWDLAKLGVERPFSVEEAVAAIEAELRSAVRARLMSEVPLGAFLSGGIDSGLVVSLMAKQLGPGVKTVTVGFSGEASETEAARLVARHHATDHAEYTVEPELGRLMDRLLSHFGEPFADCSALPTWHVSREARRRVTVALTGDGGDESFGGYDFRFVPHRRDARLRALFPGRLFRAAFRALAGAWPARQDLPRPVRLQTLFRNLGLTEERAFCYDLCFTKPPLALALAPELGREGQEAEAYVCELYRSGGTSDPLQAIMKADARFYLPEDVLVKVDRMSMAHGLEVRSPLLSRRVVELAFCIPSRLKMPDGTSKALLRRLAASYVPRELLSLPKRGFHVPLDRWLRQDLRSAFEQDVLAAPGGRIDWLDRRVLSRLWQEHLSGRFQHGHTLWMLWAYRAWSRAETERPAAPIRERDLVRA
jgi:asparagine synthase (glutamine-hydrolysing)